MTYPLSSDVAAGQPTAAAHYNNLRADALRLGQPAADAVTLASLLGRFESGLALELLGSNRLRVPAASTAPVSLVISGVPLSASANVDLPTGSAPAGSAMKFYVFAVASPGSQTFTLDVNTSPTESTGRRLIGRFYWNGTEIDAASIQVEGRTHLQQVLGSQPALACEGRLTGASGSPVTAADVPNVGTLYFTPYNGSRVALYGEGSGWVVYPFSELSLSLAGLDAGKNVDVFIHNYRGTLTLSLEVWTNDSTRAAALAAQDGVMVKAGAPALRYLGTIRTVTSGVTADTDQARLIWNCNNRLPRRLKVIESANSWTYTTAAFRPFNNSNANRVEVVTGLAELPTTLQFLAYAYHSGGQGFHVGIGLDSTTTSSADVNTTVHSSTINPTLALFNQVLSEGYHYLQLLEIGASTITWFGDYGSTIYQSGAVGVVYA